jgi:N-succinyl-L-ornithine transcarbamylase
MKRFTTVHDVVNVDELVDLARSFRNDPLAHRGAGENRTLGLVFLNPSLRTRMSTQKAAMNLGLQVMVLNAGQESWALEFSDGAVMNGSKVEHVKDAAAIMGMYCDIVAIRSFPSLTDRDEDYSEHVLQQFMRYCPSPVVSLESATRHPLQSLADLMTIRENAPHGRKPKVALTWAPHIKPLPQAVANSFAEWMTAAGMDLHIAQPQGYDLAEEFTAGATVCGSQEEALENADFVYVKNWSSYKDYGRMLSSGNAGWLLTEEKMKLTRNAHIMHCLPVRRNVEVPDALLDNPRSLILRQAENRIYAAQAVLYSLLGEITSKKEISWSEKELSS